MRFVATIAMLAGALLLVDDARGQHWTQLSPVVSPPARSDHAMAFDEARGQMVVFGGIDSGIPFGDTWLWDRSAWSQPAVAGPSPRQTPAMAYDSARRRVIMFGGGGYTDETWEWDGTAWNLATPSSSPPRRRSGALAYDSVRGRVVMFGGGGPGLLSDTWEWDGSTWTETTPAISPPARIHQAMAFDPVRNKTILFGGQLGSGGWFGDTWAYDGTSWTQLSPSTFPSPRSYVSLAFDASRSVMVLVGGTNGSILSDTWEWDGSDWSMSPASASSPPIRGYGLAFDTGRQQLVLFGGSNSGTGNNPRNETWALSFVQSTYTVFGTACGSPAPTLTNSKLPAIGQRFEIHLSNLPTFRAGVVFTGLSSSTWGAVALPFDLTVAGMPGCSLYARGEIQSGFTTHTSTSYSWGFTVPNDAELLGSVFFNQGLIVDPLANPGGVITTEGGQATVGTR